MKRLWVVLAVVALLGVGVGAAVWNRQIDRDIAVRESRQNVKVTPPAKEIVIIDRNGFSFELFSQIAGLEKNRNVFISPMSISLALSMTYNGASGETREAMAQAFGLKGMSLREVNEANKALLNDLNNLGPDVEMSIANSLWARQGYTFDKGFLQQNREFYGAKIASLDFHSPDAPGVMNSWVKRETRGKITSIVDSIPDNAILYLVNSIYFKGKWYIPFDRDDTHDEPFHLSNGNTKQVRMMHCTSNFEYLDEPDFQAIHLSYQADRLGMYVFLPVKGSNLSEFYSKLTESNWKKWIDKMESAYDERDVGLSLPQFKMSYDVELSGVLSALGMGVAFDQNRADFSGMCPESVWISRVLHKAFIEVDEEGTEAAAATAVECQMVGLSPHPEKPFKMVVDRPFFIAIADDKSGEVLFMGAVNEPE